MRNTRRREGYFAKHPLSIWAIGLGRIECDCIFFFSGLDWPGPANQFGPYWDPLRKLDICHFEIVHCILCCPMCIL
jgi:hypothetical protein